MFKIVDFLKQLGFTDILATPKRICASQVVTMPKGTSYEDVNLNLTIKKDTLTIYRDSKVIYKGILPQLAYLPILLGLLTYKKI